MSNLAYELSSSFLELFGGYAAVWNYSNKGGESRCGLYFLVHDRYLAIAGKRLHTCASISRDQLAAVPLFLASFADVTVLSYCVLSAEQVLEGWTIEPPAWDKCSSMAAR